MSNQSLFDLSGRVALVTGGSKGLGKAMARGFAQAGADVVISSRHQDELDRALVEILEGTGSKGLALVADLARREEAESLARRTLEEMGRVDVLVNNAGSNIPAVIDEIRDADWDRIVELNLSSCMVLTRALVPQMKERRWGRVIHISSIMGPGRQVQPQRLQCHQARTDRAVQGQCAGFGLPQHYRQLHRTGSLLDGFAGVAAEPGPEGRVCPADGAGALGRVRGAHRPGPVAGHRGRQLYHRGNPGG